MNQDAPNFLRLVGRDLPPAKALRVPPDDASDAPAPIRRIMLAGRGLEAAYAAKCEECDRARRQVSAADEAYIRLAADNAARIAWLEHELAQRPRLLTARALRWLRIGRALGQV